MIPYLTNDSMISPISIERQALGRSANIGDFYDAVTDEFSLFNLFDQEIPSQCLNVENVPSSSSKCLCTNTTNDKMNMLNAEADLSLSFASGFIKCTCGSGTYLNEERNNKRSMHFGYLYRFQHHMVKLHITHKDLAGIISTHGIPQNATHVVVGIMKGCNALIAIEHVVDETTSEKLIMGKMDLEFKILDLNWREILNGFLGKTCSGADNQSTSSGEDTPSNSKKPSLSSSSSDRSKQKKTLIDKGNGMGWNGVETKSKSTVSLKIFADVHINDGLTPKSFEEAGETIKKIAQSAGEGESIGPLYYVLIDVNSIAEVFNLQLQINKIFTPMSDSSVAKCTEILEESEKKVLKINQFTERLKEYEDFIPAERFQIVLKKQHEVRNSNAKLREKVAVFVTKARLGEHSVDLFEECVTQSSNVELTEFLKENRDLERLITFIVILQSHGVHFIDSIELFWDLMDCERTYFLILSLSDISRSDNHWRSTRSKFTNLCKEEGTICAIIVPQVAVQIEELDLKEGKSKIFVTRNGKYESKDLLGCRNALELASPTEAHQPSEGLRLQSMESDPWIYDENTSDSDWNTIDRNSHLLLHKIKEMTPHAMEDTLSIHRSSVIIGSLSHPCAESVRLIVKNKKIIQDEMNTVCKLVSCQKPLNQLQVKTQIEQDRILLKKPNVICNTAHCTEWVKPHETLDIEPTYRVCYEKGSFWSKIKYSLNTYGNEVDMFHGAEGRCTECSCAWSSHSIQNIEIKYRFNQVHDRNVELILKTYRNRAEAANKILEAKQDQVSLLNKELSYLLDCCAECAAFLETSSLQKCADLFAQFLQRLQREEQGKIDLGGDRSMFDELSRRLSDYEKRVRHIVQQIQEGRRKVLSGRQLNDLIESLRKLPRCGKMISEVLSCKFNRENIDASLGIREADVCTENTTTRI